MHTYIKEGDGRKEVKDLSWAQSKQACAIMDCFGRMIPQEGIDYDVEIVFKGANDPSVSMYMITHTEKGEWWKQYTMEMIKKYPPTVENPEQAIDESKTIEDFKKEADAAKGTASAVEPDTIIQPANASPTHDLEHHDAEVVS